MRNHITLRASAALALLPALALLLAPASASAGRTPMPVWAGPGTHAYRTDVAIDVTALEAALARLAANNGVQYLVVLVEAADRAGTGSPDAPGDPAVEYADELFDAWVKAGALGRGLDARRHVLIVHAIGNRSVGVHWGVDLDRLGFHNEAGAAVIDRSDFARFAASGMHAEANQALAEQIDREITTAERRRAEEARRREEADAAYRRALEELVAAWPARSAAVRAAADEVGRRFPKNAAVERHLASARKSLRRAETALEDRDVSEAKLSLARAEASVETARERGTSDARLHRFLTRTLPAIVGGVVALFALLLLVGARRLRRARGAELVAALARWQRLLADGATRLMALEERHAIFFRSTVDLGARLTGDSLVRYQEVGAAVDALILAFDAASARVAEVEAAGRAAGPLSFGAVAAVTRRLTEGDVELTTEARHERYRLFLPEARREQIPVDRLLGEIDARYGRAVELLERLHADWRAAPEAQHALAGALDETDAALGRVAEAGLPTAPWAEERARLGAERDRAAGLVAADFLAARRVADEARAAAGALAGRLGRTAAAAAALATEVHPALDAVEARIAELRSAGTRVREPIFEPEVEIADARAITEAAREALAEGGLEEGEDRLARARALAGATTARVDETVASRDQGPARLADARARLAELRGRIPAARRLLEDLAARYAPSSFAAEADNLEECAPLFTAIERLCAEAEVDGAPATQRYLAAAAALDRAENALAAVAGLLGDIEARQRLIEEAAERARAAIDPADAARRVLANRVRTDGHAIHAGPIAVAEEAALAIEALRGAMAAPRPDWLELDARVAAVGRSIAEADADARADVEAHARARAATVAAAARVAEVKAGLAASSDDRAPANARLAAAAEDLARAEEALAAPHGDWELALAAATSATALAGSAAELHASDARAAQLARAAMSTARDEIQATDRGYGRGVTADVGAARAALGRAGPALAEQRYEDALREAESARAAASAAANSARARVAELERQEREAARRAAAAAAARRSSYSSSSSSSSSRRSSFSSSSSRSSSSRSSSSSSSRSYSSRSSGSSSGSRSSGRRY